MMAARVNKRRAPTLIYKVAVREMADSFGWREKDLWFHFQQLAWLHEFEQQWPREVAEFVAHRDIVAVFDKRGRRPS